MSFDLSQLLPALGPYSSYVVFEGWTTNNESDPYNLPGGIKRLDIIVMDSSVRVRLFMPEKSSPQQIALPAGTVYTIFASPSRFTVQSHVTNNPAHYVIVAWM